MLDYQICQHQPRLLDRRSFLGSAGGGFGGMALAALALLNDLKSIGLLDETLVICTSEFGRMCCTQGGKGRDHNPFVFTSWMAGGGIKGGTAYGESDEFAYKVVEDPVSGYDLHATALHVLGIDHTKLTHLHNGIERRLTDVHGRVIREIL